MFLISNIQKTIYIQFDNIVKSGLVTILNKQHQTILKTEFHNTNFVKCHLDGKTGLVTIKVNYDSENGSKTIKI